MKKLNENVTINQVELNNWKYDEDGFMYPVSYQASVSFHGKEYIFYFTTDDLRQKEDWGLDNSGCEGDEELFDSAESYFSNHDKEADALMEMLEEEWEDYWREDSPYNFMGIKDE